MIVGVTPATMDPPLIQKVKKEPRTPPLSPNRGQGMKEVSEDGSSSQKTVEKAQEDDVVGKLPSVEKPEEAESADKEGEGSSSNSTPQKKQVICMATVTKNTNTDTEKLKKKQVMCVVTATENTNTDTEKPKKKQVVFVAKKNISYVHPIERVDEVGEMKTGNDYRGLVEWGRVGQKLVISTQCIDHDPYFGGVSLISIIQGRHC